MAGTAVTSDNLTGSLGPEHRCAAAAAGSYPNRKNPGNADTRDAPGHHQLLYKRTGDNGVAMGPIYLPGFWAFSQLYRTIDYSQGQKYVKGGDRL